MAVLTIIRMGHPRLNQVAEEVDPRSDETKQIIADMLETLEASGGGLGLAAPQVNISKRIIIYNIPSERNDEELEVPMKAIINPVILKRKGDVQYQWEACFSVPDLVGMVPRKSSITYRYQNQRGETFEETATGFHARVLQHEIDHLDGILYPQRMDDMSQFGFQDEIFG